MSAELQHPAGTNLAGLSKSLRETEDVLSMRKRYLKSYLSSPYETNQIFLKNYERPNGEPSTLNPSDVQGEESLLGGNKRVIGCVGRKIFADSIPTGVSLATAGGATRTGPFIDEPSEASDHFELLNVALRNDLQQLTVGEWKKGAGPLTRLTVLPAKDSALHRRSVIKFGTDVSCDFVDMLRDPSGQGPAGGFLNEILDVHLAPGASVNFVSLFSGHAQVAISYRVRLEEGARLALCSWAGGIPYLRSRIDVLLKGHGGDAGVFCGNYAKERGRHDMMVTVEHVGRNTTGLAVQNGVVKTGSRLLLKGMMIIRNPARGADSHLKQHALLLSHDSYANAIPGLEIETNELKAKHAASVSQPDDEQIFYLESRGLDKAEAVNTVALGNLGPVVTNIRDPSLRESVSEEIEDTLRI